MRQEYIDHPAAYVNASSAAGQPFFAHLPPQFIHPTPPGMSYLPPGGIRHPGIQPQMFIQQHPHQGPMMLPVGQMPPPGHYPDSTIYYGNVLTIVYYARRLEKLPLTHPLTHDLCYTLSYSLPCNISSYCTPYLLFLYLC